MKHIRRDKKGWSKICMKPSRCSLWMLLYDCMRGRWRQGGSTRVPAETRAEVKSTNQDVQQIKERKFDCNNTKSVSMSHQGFIGIKSGACSCFLVDRTETRPAALVRAVHAEPPRHQKALFVPSFVVANKTQKIPAVGTSVCHLFSRVLLSVLSSVQMS